MAKFRLTQAARRDLLEIGRYTMERWGVDQAHRYLTELDERIHSLGRDPTSGRSCDEVREGYWRAQQGRHQIFYKIARKTVEIVRILHERMLPRRHL